MPQILPFDAEDPSYRVRTTLGSVQYGFDARWNSRDEAWYLTIRDETGEVIRAGIRVALGLLLGGRCVDPRFPAGGLLAVDRSGQGVEAGEGDLGGRVGIYYLTPAEVVAL